MWINTSDIILIGLRDYQDAKADVILKYTPDEARNLKAYGELPENGMYQHTWYLLFLYFSVDVFKIVHQFHLLLLPTPFPNTKQT